MKKYYFSLSVCFLLICCHSLQGWSQPAKGGRQQMAAIGDFRLHSGDTIFDCQIGYRTYGRLNAKKTNIILFSTWFSGTTADLEQYVVGKQIDSIKYFVILVDALGDGVSSSPSNSRRQPGLRFPVYSIKDMVESQFQLLTLIFHFSHVYAISGISMGGMQSFQWAVSHPEFADKIIPILGSPQLTANDLLLWTGELRAMEADTAYHMGDYTGEPTIASVSVLHRMALTTPEYIASTTTRDHFPTMFKEATGPSGFDWNDWHRQLEAMISHDIAAGDHGSLEVVAKKIKAKMLIITSRQDHMVNPIPATRMAHLLGAQLLELRGNCGHLAGGCESIKLIGGLKAFVGQ